MEIFRRAGGISLLFFFLCDGKILLTYLLLKNKIFKRNFLYKSKIMNTFVMSYYKNNKQMKNLLFFLMCIFAVVSCTKEETLSDFIKPTLRIDSCVVSGNGKATAYVYVDKGENFFNHKLVITVHDMENSQQEVATIDVQLGNERVLELAKEFTLPETDKIYIVSLMMTTDKNSFVGNSVVLNTHSISMTDNFLYKHSKPLFYDFSDDRIYRTSGIGAVVSDGSRILISFYGENENDAFQLKVGDKLIETDVSYSYFEQEFEIWGEVKDIPGGTYDVSLIWNGKTEIPLEQKLLITPWKVNMESTCSVSEFPDLPFNSNHSFRIGSKLYYGTVYADASTLVSYDCATNKWTKLKDIPYKISSITELGDKAYAITSNFDVFSDKQEKDILIEYNPSTDTWSKIADFPNNGNLEHMHIFSAGGNIYMCAGDLFATSERLNKMWKYDLGKRQWVTMNDIPKDMGYNGEHRMEFFSGESMGYAMDFAHGKLWTYNPQSDKWTYESLLKSKYLAEANLGLMEYNGKLLYFSHGDDSSAYSYDFKTRTWELLSVYVYRNLYNVPLILPMAICDNKLMVGPFIESGYKIDYMNFLTVNIK